MVTNIHDKEELDGILRETTSQTLLILEFHSQWCSACRTIGPKIESLAKDLDSETVKIYAVDVDECEDVVNRYGISNLPTFQFMKRGNILETIVGSKFELFEDTLNELKSKEPTSLATPSLISLQSEAKNSKKSENGSVSSAKQIEAKAGSSGKNQVKKNVDDKTHDIRKEKLNSKEDKLSS